MMSQYTEKRRKQEMIQLTIVYDDVNTSNAQLEADHGFSCYIETKENTLLFDSGTDGKILLNNMKALNKNPRDIDTIIISHEHYDHNGGLKEVCQTLEKPTIYRLENDVDFPFAQNVVSDQPQEIVPNIFTTGRLKGSPLDEQSLILKHKDGIFVLVGCSHSGLEHILPIASSYGAITGVMGGFHGFDNFSLLKEINDIYPAHCTVHKKRIHDLYPTQAHPSVLGLTITLH